MERKRWIDQTLSSAKISNPGSNYPITETGIGYLFDDLLGLSRGSCSVSFSKTLGSAYFYNGGSSNYLCFVWSQTQADDDKATITITLPSTMRPAPSAVSLIFYTDGRSHGYNREIPVQDYKIILNKGNCLNLDSGSYRNIFGCARALGILYVDDIYTGTLSNISFFKENSNTWEGYTIKTQFVEWAQHLGFEDAIVNANIQWQDSGGGWLLYDGNHTAWASASNHSGFLHFKTIPYAAVKFKGNDYDGRIITRTVAADGNGWISLTNVGDYWGYPEPEYSDTQLLGIKEINLGKDSRTLYNFTQNYASENFTIVKGVPVSLKDDVGSSPGTESLQGGGDSILNEHLPEDILQISSDALTAVKAYLNNSGGMVRSKRFLTNDKYNYGYSLASTRTSPTQQNGNFIYEDNSNNQPRTALNSTYMFNYKNPFYYPVYIGYSDSTSSVVVSDDKVIVDGKTTYFLNPNDRIICYEASLSYKTDVNLFKWTPTGYPSYPREYQEYIWAGDYGDKTVAWGHNEDSDWGFLETYCGVQRALTLKEVNRSNQYSTLSSTDALYQTATSLIEDNNSQSTLVFKSNPPDDNDDRDEYGPLTYTTYGDYTPVTDRKYGYLGSAYLTTNKHNKHNGRFYISYTLYYKRLKYNNTYIEPKIQFDRNNPIGTAVNDKVYFSTSSWNGNGITFGATFKFDCCLVPPGDYKPFSNQPFYFVDRRSGGNGYKTFPYDNPSESVQNSYWIDYAYREWNASEGANRIVFRVVINPYQRPRPEAFDWYWFVDNIVFHNNGNNNSFPHKYQYVIWKSIL